MGNSSYARGDMVEAREAFGGGTRLGRVLAVDGNMLLVDEHRPFGWWPVWWRARVWRRLKPLEGGYFEGVTYDRR